VDAAPPTSGRAVTARGWKVLGLGVVLLGLGLALRYPVVAGLGGVLLLLVAAEVLAVVVAPDLAVRRVVSPSVVVRFEECRGRLHVTGRRRAGLARLEVSDTVDGRLVAVPLPEGSKGGSVSVPYPIATPRRGIVEVGPVRLRRVGLVGLAEHTSHVGGVDEVRVLPRRIPLSGLPAGTRRSASGADVAMELGGTDLVGLHEYAVGDDLRRLHWATSARTGSLMVRDDVDPAEPHVRVLLDDRAASYADPEAFEEAVELAAALCAVAEEHGHPVRFVTTSGRHEVALPGTPTHQNRREAQELEWLLAEVGLSPATAAAVRSGDHADLAVAVTGHLADGHDVRRLLDHGSSAVLVHAVVDPAPTLTSEDHAGVLVLRGLGSTALADTWEQVLRP
jgi:uncharacterized protein (DUF58 family)